MEISGFHIQSNLKQIYMSYKNGLKLDMYSLNLLYSQVKISIEKVFGSFMFKIINILPQAYSREK